MEKKKEKEVSPKTKALEIKGEIKDNEVHTEFCSVGLSHVELVGMAEMAKQQILDKAREGGRKVI